MGIRTAASRRPVGFSIEADEVINPAEALSVHLPAAVDMQAARAAVRVTYAGEDLPVRLSLGSDGRSISVALTEGLSGRLGAHVLEVVELVSTEGDRLVDQVHLPFCVLPIGVNPDNNFFVEHSVRLEFNDLNVSRLSPGEQGRNGLAGILDQLSDDEIDSLADGLTVLNKMIELLNEGQPS